jgi:hypothetical protein
VQRLKECLKVQDEVPNGPHVIEAITSLSLVTNDVHYTGRQEHKISLALTKRLISITFNELKDFGTNIRLLTLEKALFDSMMNDFLPPYLNSLVIIKRNHEIVQNLKDGMNTHLLGHHKSKVVMAKDIV